MKKFLSFFSLFLIFALQAEAQEKQSLLWEIKSPKGKVSYLFGTYHLVGSDYLNSHKKVKEAYQKAKTVVVETVIDSSQLLQVTMLGMMPENSLRQLVDSADYVLLKEEFQRVTGYDIAMLDKMKPITVSMMYALAQAEDVTPEALNFDGQPIDLYFAAEGKRQGKEVKQLETMMEQAEILYNSSSLEEQADDLLQLVKEKEEGEDVSLQILSAYQAEDLGKMWELSETMGDAYGEMAVFVDDRNQKWIKTLKPILEQGDAFIAVGALHLPGKVGLLKLLQKEGFTISPVH